MRHMFSFCNILIALIQLFWVFTEELFCTVQSTEEDRRANFVDRLLEADNLSLNASSRSISDAVPIVDTYVEEKDDLGVARSNHRAKSMTWVYLWSLSCLNNITLDFTAKIISMKYNKSSILCITGDSFKEAACLSLQQKQENKKKTRKYKVGHSCLCRNISFFFVFRRMLFM